MAGICQDKKLWHDAAMNKVLLKSTAPDFAIENSYQGNICGIDEVGRGPLAGPVLSACVLIAEENRDNVLWRQVKDSKKLSQKMREELYLEIAKASYFGVGMANVEEIDTLNIHNATLLAMKRAFEGMKADYNVKTDHALIDGKFAPQLSCNTKTVIKGDSVSVSIASASIIAKVTRDRIMTRLHSELPFYGWDRNAGYGTKQHIDALKKHGISSHHRRSFAPIKSM
jgi:ribonuclease HII